MATEEENLDPSKPVAVILGCERAHGLVFVRSLGRKGIPVVAVDGKRGPGMRSRYARSSVVTEEELLTFLESLGRTLPAKGVLIGR